MEGDARGGAHCEGGRERLVSEIYGPMGILEILGYINGLTTASSFGSKSKLSEYEFYTHILIGL